MGTPSDKRPVILYVCILIVVKVHFHDDLVCLTTLHLELVELVISISPSSDVAKAWHLYTVLLGHLPVLTVSWKHSIVPGVRRQVDVLRDGRVQVQLVAGTFFTAPLPISFVFIAILLEGLIVDLEIGCFRPIICILVEVSLLKVVIIVVEGHPNETICRVTFCVTKLISQRSCPERIIKVRIIALVAIFAPRVSEFDHLQSTVGLLHVLDRVRVALNDAIFILLRVVSSW